MSTGRFRIVHRLRYPVAAITVLATLAILSRYNFLLYHSLAEGFSIVVAAAIFMLAWNARNFLEDGYLLFLSTVFLFVGFLDGLHTLAYKGMGVFPEYDANLPTQLWIIARYFQGLGLMIAPLFFKHRLRSTGGFSAFVIISVLTAAILGLVFSGLFPDCYVDGELTAFKVIGEYIICGILTIAGVELYLMRRHIHPHVFALLLTSIVVTILSELSFTLYTDVYGTMTILGHALKILAFYLVYLALVRTGLAHPYKLLFRDLQRNKEELAAARDETRERLEHLVRERNRDLRIAHDALSSSLAGVIIMDSENTVTFVNDSFLKMFSYTSPDQVVGRSVRRLMRLSTEAIAQLDAVDKSSEARVEEMVLITHEGRGFEAEVAVSAITDDSGKPAGLMMSVVDISDRKRMETELRKLSRVYMESADPILIQDLSGTILDLNEQVERVYGWKREDLIGLPWDTLIAGDSCREAQNLLDQSTSGHVVRNAQMNHETKLGQTFPVLITLSVLNDDLGRPSEVAALVKDISDLRRMQMELSKAYDALNSSAGAVVLTDTDGTITYANPAFLQTFGYQGCSEVIGTHFGRLFGTGNSSDAVAEKYFDTDRKTVAVEVIAQRKDGSTFSAELSASTINDVNGTAIGRIASFMDITPRKEAEHARAALTSELKTKNSELEQVLYATSHDLRSPLVNVQGFSRELEYAINDIETILSDTRIPEDLRGRAKTIIGEDIGESLKFILGSISRMDRLLSGLLRLSRLGRRETRIVETDMNAVFQEIAVGVGFRVKKAGIHLIIDNVPTCMADPEQIGQVFANLVDNAIKFLDKNRAGRIRISARTQGRESIYTVEDNGIGIPLEYQEKVFQIFHRLNPADYKGEGLGLAIVKRIVDKHRGTVTLDSEPGKGSRFHVRLPKA